MYHHSFSCALDSISFSCSSSYSEINIISAKYGVTIENSFISNLCYNDDIYESYPSSYKFAATIDEIPPPNECPNICIDVVVFDK